MTIKEKYNVAVIGAGPAGMMAAIRAGQCGASVVLIEKNEKLGVKLLLTGGGRCNISFLEDNKKLFCEKFGKEGDFILSPFSSFGTKETIDFFENNGLNLKNEDGKIFPLSDKSKDVLNLLISLLKKNNIDILYSSEVKEFKKIGKNIVSLILVNGKEIKADKYIMCAGGKSYPVTGSSGDSFLWAKRLGHNVTDIKPSLTPIEIKEDWPKSLQGISLKEVSVSFSQNGKIKKEGRGEILFTHFGLSGPLILDMSKYIGDLMRDGKIKIIIDLFPQKDLTSLDKYIQRLFERNRNKKILKALSDIFPEKLASFIIYFSHIPLDQKPNQLIKEERIRMIKFMKKIEISVIGLLGFDRAMATCGGISLKEIDSRTMQSKKINNLYFAGELINLDGPCGGYNLQLCWTTGYIAGQSAASSVK